MGVEVRRHLGRQHGLERLPSATASSTRSPMAKRIFIHQWCVPIVDEKEPLGSVETPILLPALMAIRPRSSSWSRTAKPIGEITLAT